jgi:DNA-binding CsgD family transcriptional regulator/transposase
MEMIAPPSLPPKLMDLLVARHSVSDELWTLVEPLIPTPLRRSGKTYRRADGAGRKPVDPRSLFASVLYILRHRLPWRAVPHSMGSISTLHRHFATWKRRGFFARIDAVGLSRHPEMAGLPWESLLNSPARRDLARGASKTASSTPPEPSIFDPQIQLRLLRLHASTEVSGFWNATLALLRDSIPHDAATAYLDFLDHPRTWRAARILTWPNAALPADWFERRWKMDFTTPFLTGHPGIKVFTFSDIFKDPGELQRSEYFQEFFAPYGWHHLAVVAFWTGGQLAASVALRRTKAQGPFTPGEIEFLKKLHPQVNTVLRRLIPSHQDQTKLRWLMDSAQNIPEALLFLDWKLELLHGNGEALSQCAIWNFGARQARAYNPREVFRLPAEIVHACLELKAEWLCRFAGALEGKEETLSVKLAHASDEHRTARIYLASAGREAIFKPSFRIQFEYHSAETKAQPDPTQSTLLWRLTAAERDLFELAATGSNNGEIAARLHKSVNTVKHQLTSIYRKLGINGSRRRRFEIMGTVNGTGLCPGSRLLTQAS